MHRAPTHRTVKALYIAHLLGSLLGLVLGFAAIDSPVHLVMAQERHAAGPVVMGGAVADTIVRVRGAETCTGSPIAGTMLVVTAAHCVLDSDGEVVPVTVERASIDYRALEVLVDTRYHDRPVPFLDAAVLVMDQTIPGRGAVVGDALPTDGDLTLVGYQPIDTDGSLLRGTNPHNRPLPHGASGGIVTIVQTPAGCRESAASVNRLPDAVGVHCGLIQGASGGGLFTDHDGVVELVGITSTVSSDLSSNQLVPLSSLHRLLDDPETFTHLPSTHRAVPAATPS